MKENTKNLLAILFLVVELVMFVVGIDIVAEIYAADTVEVGFFTVKGCCANASCFYNKLWSLVSTRGILLLIFLFIWVSFTRTAILQLTKKT